MKENVKHVEDPEIGTVIARSQTRTSHEGLLDVFLQ